MGTGTFLVKGMTAHVLINLGATRSFVSIAFNKKFSDAPQILDYPLEVEVADDCSMNASRDYYGCVVNLFNEIYSNDLVPIPLRGSKVITRMD